MLKPVAAYILTSLAMLVVPSFAQAACPVINGKYVMDTTVDGKPKRFYFVLFTRVERGVFSYTISKDANSFQLADGNWKPVRIDEDTGKVRVACAAPNSVRIDYIQDANGAKSYVKVTPIDETYAEFESSTDVKNGLYIKL